MIKKCHLYAFGVQKYEKDFNQAKLFDYIYEGFVCFSFF